MKKIQSLVLHFVIYFVIVFVLLLVVDKIGLVEGKSIPDLLITSLAMTVGCGLGSFIARFFEKKTNKEK